MLSEHVFNLSDRASRVAAICNASHPIRHFSGDRGEPEHPSPGYGAGYDAGFQAGLLAASQGGAPTVSPPPAQGTVAAQGSAGASAPEPARPPILALVEDFPDLFKKEVLERLDPLDLALLGCTGSAVRTAVKLSGLPRLGGSTEEPRVSIAPFCQSVSTFVWAVANGCPWHFANTCRTLARGGNLEVLRWAREHGCPWDAWTCAYAARGGHPEVLRWAREHYCPWDNLTCLSAAQSGHLTVLRWAREHDCSWHVRACALAAQGGHLQVLRWAWQHGLPWSDDTCESAAEGGHLEVLK